MMPQDNGIVKSRHLVEPADLLTTRPAGLGAQLKRRAAGHGSAAPGRAVRSAKRAMGRTAAAAAGCALGVPGRSRTPDASTVAEPGALLSAAAADAAATARANAAGEHATFGAGVLRSNEPTRFRASRLRPTDQWSDRSGAANCPARRTGWPSDASAI